LAAAAFVVNGGVGIIPNRMRGTGTEPTWVGWGTGATTAAKADTGLQTASSEARVSGTTTSQTTTNTGDTWQNVATITSASAQTIQEVACFDAVSSGTCFMHATHGAQTLAINDAIQYTIKVQFVN